MTNIEQFSLNLFWPLPFEPHKNRDVLIEPPNTRSIEPHLTPTGVNAQASSRQTSHHVRDPPAHRRHAATTTTTTTIRAFTTTTVNTPTAALRSRRRRRPRPGIAPAPPDTRPRRRRPGPSRGPPPAALRLDPAPHARQGGARRQLWGVLSDGGGAGARDARVCAAADGG